MDPISYGVAAKQKQRIEKVIAEPDSTSGVITVPKVIATGETITVPAGRVAILPNVQVDGTLNVQGDVFIPSGATMSKVVEKVTSTDNAVVRFNGTTGEVQNSGVIIDDSGNIMASNTESTMGGSEAFSIKYAEGQKVNVISSVRSSSAWSIGFGVKPSSTTMGEFVSTVDNDTWTRGALLIDETLKFYKANTQNATIGSTVSMTEVFRTNQNGDFLLTSGTGALGYGTGSGGTVTQLTSKSTAVTLNKPTGTIITNDSALAAGATVSFVFFNSVYTNSYDLIYFQMLNNANTDKYNIWAANNGPRFGFVIFIKNISASSLSDVLTINFSLIKGAIA